MANLAIKGHSTRGNEVINLLEMLGANRLGYKDTFIGFYYYIECGAICSSDEYPTNSTIFTLEEFEKKFPYKVGDKVCYQPNSQIDTICVSEIISMKWVDNSVIYFTSNAHSLYACDLQPYKEESMEKDTNKAIFEGNAQSCDIMNDIIKEETMEDKDIIEQTTEINLNHPCFDGHNKIELIIPENWKFEQRGNKMFGIRKYPQCPKTYEDYVTRFATEEEKQKLFDAIKDNGYKWNPETKTLEKLPEPKFKVGDRIIRRDSIVNSWIVSSVSSEYYGLKTPNSSECIGILPVSEQDNYEILPKTDKFDITTLKPFKSEVLVRNFDSNYWKPAIFGFTVKDKNSPVYVEGGNKYNMCIPYEGNEHLLGATTDCDEYYKTWE